MQKKQGNGSMFVLAAGLVLGLALQLSLADTQQASQFSQGQGPNAEAEAADQACAATVAKDETGHPDHAAMQQCMSQKGFRPPRNGDQPPPPRGQCQGQGPGQNQAQNQGSNGGQH